MKKFLFGFIALFALAGSALAQEYVGADFAVKNVPHSDETHYVLGVNYGYKFDSGVTAEARMEDEVVRTPNKHEGLAQLKLAYKLPVAVLDVHPYVAAAVGYKSKVTLTFPYYIAEAGLAYTEIPNLGLKYGIRLRTPFNESSVGEGHLYRTVENSVTATYELSEDWIVSAKVAIEHGDKEYHTCSLGFAKKF